MNASHQEEMLLRHYKPEIVLPPCDPGRETINAIGHIVGDISAVFPYLNAILPAAQYNPDAQILRFPFEGHMVTLQPTREGRRDEHRRPHGFLRLMNGLRGPIRSDG